ncbi:MAG: STAS domain-containing protein [Phycisphaerales bacterium]
MFGKFRRSTDARQDDPLPRLRTGPDFGFESAPPKNVPKSLATYDQLGQTLVATPIVGTLSGPDAGLLASELCEKIHAAHHDPGAVGPGIRHVVLDLQNVQYMDSMCVGVLVELLTTLKEAGGRIALVNAAANVEYLFKLTRLDRVFPICRDVMKAIEVVERGG